MKEHTKYTISHPFQTKKKHTHKTHIFIRRMKREKKNVNTNDLGHTSSQIDSPLPGCSHLMAVFGYLPCLMCSPPLCADTPNPTSRRTKQNGTELWIVVKWAPIIMCVFIFYSWWRSGTLPHSILWGYEDDDDLELWVLMRTHEKKKIQKIFARLYFFCGSADIEQNRSWCELGAVGGRLVS